MKIKLTKEELKNRDLRHERAVEELLPTGLFASEREAKQYIDLLADRENGEPLIPSHRAWLEKVEQLMVARDEFDQVTAVAQEEGAQLAELRYQVASATERLATAHSRRAAIEQEYGPKRAEAALECLANKASLDTALLRVIDGIENAKAAVAWIKSTGLPLLEAEKAAADKALAAFLKKAGMDTR